MVRAFSSLFASFSYRGLFEVESSSFCRDVIVARMADNLVKTVPLFDDVQTFSMSNLRPKYGSLEGIMGGFPCQAGSVPQHRLSSHKTSH